VTMSELVAALPTSSVDEAGLTGEWELVYSDVELFRSSPFFLAIEVCGTPPREMARLLACCLPHTVCARCRHRTLYAPSHPPSVAVPSVAVPSVAVPSVAVRLRPP
jgi:hypothetical protein